MSEPLRTPARTPGHKAVLVSEAAFQLLKELQRQAPDDALPLTFDLKEVATALVLEAAALPNLRERVRRRALAVMHDIVTADTNKSPSKEQL